MFHALLFLWIVAGFVFLTYMAVTGKGLADIKAPLKRRVSMVTSVVVSLPAFLLLRVAEEFIEFTESGGTFKYHAKEVWNSITVDLWRDLKEAW